MDFDKIYENVIAPIGGFLIFCTFVLWAINSCSSDDESSVSTDRQKEIIIPNNYSTNDVESSSSYSDENEDAEFPEIEIDEPTGHYEYVRKQVPCHVCDGQGFTPSNLTSSGQVRCGFCSGKGFETVIEQEWVE